MILRSLLLLLAIGSASAVELTLFGVDYHEQDKQQHAILGGGVAACTILGVEKIWPNAPWYAKAAAGIAASVVVGAVKEWSDSHDLDHHTVDSKDFVATATGGAAVSLTFSIDF